MKKPFRIDYEKIKRGMYHDLYQLKDDIIAARVDLDGLRISVVKILKDDLAKPAHIIDTPDHVSAYVRLAKLLMDQESAYVDRVKLIHNLYEEEDAERKDAEEKAKQSGKGASKQNVDNSVQKLAESCLVHLAKFAEAEAPVQEESA